MDKKKILKPIRVINAKYKEILEFLTSWQSLGWLNMQNGKFNLMTKYIPSKTEI